MLSIFDEWAPISSCISSKTITISITIISYDRFRSMHVLRRLCTKRFHIIYDCDSRLNVCHCCTFNLNSKDVKLKRFFKLLNVWTRVWRNIKKKRNAMIRTINFWEITNYEFSSLLVVRAVCLFIIMCRCRMERFKTFSVLLD